MNIREFPLTGITASRAKIEVLRVNLNPNEGELL
jgi:hypothetical protein